MGQLKQIAVAGSGLAHPIHTLQDLVRRRVQKNRNLAELKKLNPVFLEDIGLFEYTREQIIRSS